MYAAILCLAIGNPAPIYREPVSCPEHVIPGHYIMTWACNYQITYNVELKADGTLLSKTGSYPSYRGFWFYDQEKRVLHFQERSLTEERATINWQVPLDCKLAGVGFAVWIIDQKAKREPLKVTLRRVKR